MAKELFTAEWFPYYWERFDESDQVAVMSLAEEGAYHRAIRLAWRTGSLPADPELMAAKIQKRCTAKIAETVLKTFAPDPENESRVIHLVVEEIRREQEWKYRNKVRGGKKAAKTRSANVANTEDGSSTEQNPSRTQFKSHKIRDKRLKIEKEEENVPTEHLSSSPKPELDVGAVFDHWKKTLDHPQAKLTPERSRCIKARLKDYSVEDIKLAIDGCKASPHHMGLNDRHTVYDSITLICRSGSHVEQFMGYASGKQKPASNGHRQPINDIEFQKMLQTQGDGDKCTVS